MARTNTRTARPAVKSPVKTVRTSSGPTHQGGPGFDRDPRSELFLFAVSNMSEDTFYESATERHNRWVSLVRTVTRQDPEWVRSLLAWLRGEGNIRTASISGAAEYVRVRLEDGLHGGNRQVIRSVIQRADEPGEMLAYWTQHYGRSLPMPVKRGIGDAVIALGTEFNYLKWDSEGRGFRFADVLNLTHPGDSKGSAQRLKGAWQGELFDLITTRPYRTVETPEALPMLTAREALMSMPVNERRSVLEDPEMLRRAGITWEALAGWLQGPMDKAAWEAVIPSMGYMALLRNLRNFDQAGVSDSVAKTVADRLADPEQVAKSRQFPFRFLSAYRAAPSLRWGWSLEQALGHSLSNVPALKGSTLILVDRSGSMEWSTLSRLSDMKFADAAAVFGAALAQRAQRADLVQYGSGEERVRFSAGESVLKVMERFRGMGGTDTWGSLARSYSGQDRVVIITDEQVGSFGRYGSRGDRVPDVPIYTWSLAGYSKGQAPSGEGKLHTFGGLTDQSFRMIPLLEAGRDASFPWED